MENQEIGNTPIADADRARPVPIRSACERRPPDLPADKRNQILVLLEKPDHLRQERPYVENTFQQLLAARQAPFPDRLKTGDLIQQHVAGAAFVVR